MYARSFLRRLVLTILVCGSALAALVVLVVIPYAPSQQHADGSRHATDSVARIQHHAANVAGDILSVLTVTAIVLATLAGVVVAGHLVGRYLRRPGPSILPGPVGAWVASQRARRAPVCVELVLGRDNHTEPYEVAKLLDGRLGMGTVRWYERLLLGSDTICLGLVNHPASRTFRFTATVRGDSVAALEHRLRGTYRDLRTRPLQLWPSTPGGPLTRLAGRGRPCPFELVRLKKTRRWIWSLQTTRDYTHSQVEALVATMAGSDTDCQIQLAITPAPTLLERWGDRAIRRVEQRLNTEVAVSPTAPGVQSAVAQKHLQGAAESVGRSLYFLDYRILVPRGQLGLARQLAGVASEARAENNLTRRVMRARRRLYVQRLAYGIPNLFPGLRRGVVSAAELATLWHLPTLRVKDVGLQRSGSRQIIAPAAISRDPAHALLVDELGPVGIHPDDRRYGHVVIGAAGGGKSALVAQHVAVVAHDPSRALIVLDPKEDLARAVLCAIPEDRIVHYIDLAHPHIGINPLTALRSRGVSSEVTADLMVAAIRESTGDTAVGPRSDQFLRAAFDVVSRVEHDPTLHHAHRMLDPDDPGYRDWVVRELAYHPETEHLQDFWGRSFQARAKANHRFLAEIMEAPRNKLARFLAVPSLRYLTSHPVALDLPGLIDRREILIVSGSKGAVGEDNAILFLQTLVLLIQKLLHQQQRLSAKQRVQVALVIDEAHNLFTPSFATMLSEGRSGGLEVLAAFQYTQQIQDERVKAGIKSLLQNVSIFRLRELDDARNAAALAMDVYADSIRGNDEDAHRLRQDPVDIVNLPNYRASNLWLAHGEPQHAFTAHTRPWERLENALGASQRRALHLDRQRDRGYHPHDHDQPIVPPAVWTIDQPVLAHGRQVLVDLTEWTKRPENLRQVAIALVDTDGAATAYPAVAADSSGRRWAVHIPAEPDAPGHLPAGRYTIQVIAGPDADHVWNPTVKVGHGAEQQQIAANITLREPNSLAIQAA